MRNILAVMDRKVKQAETERRHHRMGYQWISSRKISNSSGDPM
jgi:hypothetical protein